MAETAYLTRALGMLGVLAALLLTGCWSSAPRQDVIAKLERAEQQVRELEARAESDRTTAKLAANSRDQIERARELIIEADFNGAAEILDVLNNRLAEGASTSPGSIAEPGVHGLVEYKVKGENAWRRYTGAENLADAKALRSGVRSAAFLDLPVGGELLVHPQTELAFVRFDSTQTHLRLDKGVATLDKTSGREVVLELEGYQARSTQDVLLELSLQTLIDARYIAVHRGSTPWNEAGENGLLNAGSGFAWIEDKRREVSLPLAPAIDKRDLERTVYVSANEKAAVSLRWFSNVFIPECQVQVSAHPRFVIRVFDRMGIRTGDAEAMLPPGDYYWRVRGFNQENTPGPFSKTAKLSVRVGTAKNLAGDPTVSDMTPLLSDLDVEVINTMAIISGRTSSDSRVRVNGVAAVMLDAGKFRAIVNFDRAGNHSLRIVATNMNNGAETVAERKVLIKE